LLTKSKAKINACSLHWANNSVTVNHGYDMSIVLLSWQKLHNRTLFAMNTLMWCWRYKLPLT